MQQDQADVSVVVQWQAYQVMLQDTVKNIFEFVAEHTFVVGLVVQLTLWDDVIQVEETAQLLVCLTQEITDVLDQKLVMADGLGVLPVTHLIVAYDAVCFVQIEKVAQAAELFVTTEDQTMLVQQLHHQAM